MMSIPCSSSSAIGKQADPYTRLSENGVGTPCQLNGNDTRAIYRLSQWMSAYAQKRRGGTVPPQSGETAAEAYYMVSFFMLLRQGYERDSNKYSDVDKRFGEV